MCGSAPSAPQLPAYPDLTSQQQAILQPWQQALNQQQNVTQGVAGQLGQNQSILQGVSGLFNPDGSINQNALAQIQGQVQGSTGAAGTGGLSALGYLNQLYGQGGAVGQTTQAYQNALQGNVPANQQLQYTTGQNWNQLKEQAAQQGITINGDNWNSATSNSSAGQKLIQDFQQNYNIQNQNYQLGYMGMLGQNLGNLGAAGAQAANQGMGLSQYSQQTPLNYLGQSISGGMGALTPYLTQYQQSAGQLYQPYYMQQIGPYQQQMAQAQANYQGAMQQYNANQSQIMGWASLGMNGALQGAQTYGKYFMQ